MSGLHLRNFDLNLLLVFDAVYESGSVGRAASRLGLTQPAVSHALRRLRDAVGDELFRREGREMKPTPRAGSLAGPVRTALQQLQGALGGAQTFDPARCERTFRLAMPDYAEWLLLPDLLRRVSRESAGVRIQVKRVETLFAPPLEELRRGEVDAAAGFFPDPRGLEVSLLQETIFRERNVIVLRKGHPALRRKWTFELFADLPHAAVIYGPDPRGFIDREMAARGRKRRLVYASPHFLGALQAVSCSDLVACLPETMVRRFAKPWGLEWREPPLELPEFTLRLVWPRTVQDDAEHRWFREVLLAAAGGGC